MIDFSTTADTTLKAVSVPIYATNTTSQAEYIATDAGLKLVFVGDQAQYDKVESFKANAPHLQTVIAFDKTTRLSGDRSLYFDDFIRMGAASTGDAELERRLDSATSDDVATVIYTSGTTGDPKGAVLTHANFFHQFRATDERFEIVDGNEGVPVPIVPFRAPPERRPPAGPGRR